ncbi:MAG: glutamine--fructose-6-phosphate transaminase (isomerizing) [Thermodesulfobacteriota bacterium]
MCGIVGYVGFADKTCGVVCGGLEKLDSRGYDSAGICLMSEKGASVFRSPGKLERLAEKIGSVPPSGTVGIGHTRWATQGDPESCSNAHPQTAGAVSVVHNGVVENWRELRAELEAEGREFLSGTDTEVISHLVDRFHSGGDSLLEAVRKSFEKINGCSAVAVVSEKEPDTIVVAKRFSPIVLADTGDEKFIASDVPALAEWCKEVTLMRDGDFAVVKPEGITITDSEGNVVERPARAIDKSGYFDSDKGGFSHYMIKEIYDQPHAVADALRGRIDGGGEADALGGLDKDFAREVERVVFVGCGTSHHAGIAGRYLVESMGGLFSDAEIASEFCYRETVFGRETLVVAVSQSGETADTSHALAKAKRLGARTVVVTNNSFGKMVDEADGVILTRAGREFSVASTKTFTSQVAVFCALALFFGRSRGGLGSEALKLEKDLRGVAEFQAKCLALDDEIAEIAAEFAGYSHMLYLGRGLGYPVALEGALKLKEVSYIHAEGAAAGEMKHGPIAMIDEKVPVVFIFPSRDEPSFEKTLSNMAEVKARRGRVLAVTSSGDVPHLDENDRIIRVPECGLITNPLVSMIALQLFAYHTARALGKDVDQPRNLAKVVTVE